MDIVFEAGSSEAERILLLLMNTAQLEYLLRKIFEALVVGRCKRISSLVLSNNGLADETARVMHQLLQAIDVCTLTSLDLSNNSINQQSLSRAIKRNSTLKYLNVRSGGG